MLGMLGVTLCYELELDVLCEVMDEKSIISVKVYCIGMVRGRKVNYCRMLWYSGNDGCCVQE